MSETTVGLHAGCTHVSLLPGVVYCPRIRLVYVNTLLAQEAQCIRIVCEPLAAMAAAVLISWVRWNLPAKYVLGYVWVRNDVVIYGMRGEAQPLKKWLEGQPK